MWASCELPCPGTGAWTCAVLIKIGLQHTLLQLSLPQPAAREATRAAAPLLSVRPFTSRNNIQREREEGPRTSRPALFCLIYPLVNKSWRFPGKSQENLPNLPLHTPTLSINRTKKSCQASTVHMCLPKYPATSLNKYNAAKCREK